LCCLFVAYFEMLHRHVKSNRTEGKDTTPKPAEKNRKGATPSDY